MNTQNDKINGSSASPQPKSRSRLSLRKSKLLQKLLPRKPWLRTAIKVAFAAVLLGLLYVGLVRFSTGQANRAIDEKMVGYFNALDKQDYDAMRGYLYPTDNDAYLLDILLKSKAVGTTSVRLQKIYPALVNGDLAVVGFESSTNATFNGKDSTIREVNMFFFRKKDGEWYIAKPEDLSNVPEQRISGMIDRYTGVMKENITAESMDAQIEYNRASFRNLKNGGEQHE